MLTPDHGHMSPPTPPNLMLAHHLLGEAGEAGEALCTAEIFMAFPNVFQIQSCNLALSVCLS